MVQSWAQRKMIGLDYETTDVDTEQARIVTGTLYVIEPGVEPVKHSWLVDPGVEIPEATTAIHGISTEKARAEGMSPAEALGQMTWLLGTHWTPEVPLVAYNASYDLSLYRAESTRHGVPAVDLEGRHVVDPLVIDRHVDRYRKGGRKLGDVCKHYRVELVDAHTSDADTLATLRLAYQIARRYPQEVGLVDLPTLHSSQRVWHRLWAQRMATFLRKEATRLATNWDLAKTGRSVARKFVVDKLAYLGITEDPTDELIARQVTETRARADDFAGSAEHWPIRPAAVPAA
jgi:DNA polymerase-3 subunit epsilon